MLLIKKVRKQPQQIHKMPNPNKNETEGDFVSRCIPIVMKEGTAKNSSQAAAICHSKFKESKTKHKELTVRPCIGNLEYKEDKDIYTGLLATTHPDRVGDICSEKVIDQIISYVNEESKAGDQLGAYRSVSLSHDWVHSQDPEKDEAAFILPGARKVDLPGGHKGVEVDFRINKFYKGDVSPEEIKFRIDNGGIAGLSIEYDTDEEHSKQVQHNGKKFRFIEELTEFGGSGLARARMIANPMAVIYKEIELKAKEVNTMADEKTNKPTPIEVKEKELAEKEKALAEKEAELEAKAKKAEEEKSEAEKKESKEKELEEKEKKLQEKEIAMKVAEGVDHALSVKEILQSKEFKSEIDKHLKIGKKVLNTKEINGDENMDPVTLSIKEINKSLEAKEFDGFQYKEAASKYFDANKEKIDLLMKTSGIPLRTSLRVKCDGTKIKVVGKLQTKDTLDTSTNASTLTQNIAEFADVYVPGLVDTFNTQTNLFGNLEKRNHIEGGDKYGWKIRTSQQSSLSVDPDDTSVSKKAVKKLKLQTPIKEYRLGVSVTDYVLHHSRATMGDLFMVEVESTMSDIMKDINGDLFTEQADGDGTKILGLEAVADSAGNTTLYGLTRSSANRLAPDSAADTYTAVGGALTTAYIRLAARKPEVDGAKRANLRVVINPIQRDKLFELKEDSRRNNTDAPVIGFNAEGNIMVDGIPVWVDSDCQSDAWFVIDLESYYIVVSRAPQLTGLARAGAAEEAYVNVYLAAVYERPRRIYMLNTLTAS